MKFQGEVAVITGSGKGIGKSIAIKLAEQGAFVFLTSLSKNCINLAKKIRERGFQAEAIQANLENPDEINMLFDSIINNKKKIDILINNAGISQNKLSLKIQLKEWDTILNLNLRASFLCIQSVLKYMLKQKKGKILNISSIVGITGNLGQSHYSASKAGLIVLTKSIAKEVASRGIEVNSICPGFIQTSMLDKIDKKILENYRNQIPLKRFGKVEEVANLVSFLVSKEASYITGQNFIIDGGFMMYHW